MAITKLGNKLLNNIVASSAGVLGSLGGAAAQRVLNPPLLKAFDKAVSNQRFTNEESSQLIKKMLGNRKTNVVSVKEPIQNGYNPLTDTVQAMPNTSALAHELGHATGLLSKNPKVGEIAARFTHNFGGHGALGARGAEAAVNAYNAAKGLPPNKLLKAQSRASQVATLGQLAEEAQATIRGAKAVYDLKGKDAAIQTLKDMAPGFGTYAANAVGSHIVAPAIGKRLGTLAAKHF